MDAEEVKDAMSVLIAEMGDGAKAMERARKAIVKAREDFADNDWVGRPELEKALKVMRETARNGIAAWRRAAAEAEGKRARLEEELEAHLFSGGRGSG